MNYKETQYGLVMNIIFIILFFAFIFLYIFEYGDNPMPLSGLLIIMLVFFSIILLFFKLTVSIEGDYLRVVFGIGIINKSIKISEIHSATKVRNKWYYGWGIKFIPNGILYNISGFDAVELKFKNKSSIIRIGVKPNSQLYNKIQERLTS